MGCCLVDTAHISHMLIQCDINQQIKFFKGASPAIRGSGVCRSPGKCCRMLCIVSWSHGRAKAVAPRALQGAWKPKSKIRSASSMTCQVHCARSQAQRNVCHVCLPGCTSLSKGKLLLHLICIALCTYVSKDHISV